MPGFLWSVRADARTPNRWLERSRPLTAAARPAERARRRPRPALLLGVFLLSLYLLTMGGHLDSPDEELMFQVTRSLVERGSLNITNTAGAERLTQTREDGRTYVPNSPVASALSVPFYKVGQGLALLLPSRYSEVVARFAVGLRDPLITALAGLVFYALALELGYGETVAVLLALAFGTATLVWPFSKYSFSEPVTGLFLLLSVYAAVRTVRRDSPTWSGVSALTLGVAIGSKATAGFAAPALVVYLAAAGSPTLTARARRVLPWLLVLALPAVGLALVNLARFGNPLDTGYSISGLVDFSHPIGIAGLLVSPSKSLFLYAPIGLLGLAGFWPLWRRWPWEAGLFCWLVTTHVIFHGVLAIWPGDAGWGPRYLVPIVPFIVLPAGAALVWTSGRVRRAGWLAFGALCGVGVIVNLGGVVVDQRVSFVKLLDEAGGNLVVMDEHRWNPALSPVLIHWQEAATRVVGLIQTLSQPVSLVSGTYGKETSETGTSSSAGLFPRWTSGSAVFDLSTHGQPAELSLAYFDNRPDGPGSANVQVVIDGAALPAAAVKRSESTVTIPDKGAPLLLDAKLDDALAGHDSVRLELRSKTWQPARDAPPNPDVRELGVEIWDLHISSNGTDLAMGETLLSPMPVTDARPWSTELEDWFYTPRWHVADVWLWYLYLSGLPHALLLLGLLPLAGAVWSAARLGRLLTARQRG